jgi:inosine/xanthosine triphosphatase
MPEIISGQKWRCYNLAMIVAVGSTNPTKIEPVKSLFTHHFPGTKVVGVSVSSGVSDQPMNDAETYQGALNRATDALAKVPGAEYGVGIEGGLDQHHYGWFERSLVVIINKSGEIGTGSSGGLVLPPKVIAMIKSGKNLEQAIDAIFGTKEIGEGIGMFGIFTNEVVTRSEGVRHGVAFALARFLHADLY